MVKRLARSNIRKNSRFVTINDLGGVVLSIIDEDKSNTN